MKLVHAADLHIDSALAGLDRYEGAPVDRIRGATRRAMENLVALCIEEEAAVLLLAGDLYDGDWKDYSTGLFFAGQMARLRDAGVRVFLVKGNHDAQSRITRELRLPDNVTELSTRKPVTVVDETLGLAVHGQGFAAQKVTVDLAAAYPDARGGLFNVGLLHTALTGRAGHAPYAPTSVEVLASKGYDYWALGHVHAREVVSTDPWIVFPGNLQGRHARETGEKGASVVATANGRVASVEHRALDVVRWASVEVDASGLASAEDVLDAIRTELEAAVEAANEDGANRLVAARLTVTGRSAAHAAIARDFERWEHEVRSIGTEVGDVWVEKVRFGVTAPIDLAELARRDDAIGQLARALDGLAASADAMIPYVATFDELRRKLPREVREGDEPLDLDDPELLRAAIADVRQLLLPRLLEGSEDS